MDENIGNEYLDEIVTNNYIPRAPVTINSETIFKVLSDPLRRKLILLIGPSGKSLSLIEKEMKIEKSLLRYHIDYLNDNEYMIIDNNIFKLNDKGLLLLSHI